MPTKIKSQTLYPDFQSRHKLQFTFALQNSGQESRHDKVFHLFTPLFYTMKEIFRDWKTLPAEILHLTFRGATDPDLYEFALVCKAWTQPAQSILYSDVVISTLPLLEKFQNCVMYNPHLGIAVKSFHLFIDTMGVDKKMIKSEALTTTASLLYRLPNLQEFEDSTLQSYIPILDALTDSRLERLKTLYEPEPGYKSGEVANYVTCALLIKDRLQYMLIADNFVFADGTSCEQIFFDRLYHKLHLFDNLTEIDIQRKTNEEIQVLEHIVENCKSLTEISFMFEPFDVHAPFNTNIAVDAISNLIPRPNVKRLVNYSNDLHDAKLLIYIMHRFPSLSSIFFRLEGYSALFHRPINQHIASQLLLYLSNINEVEVGDLRMDEGTIAESFTTFWQKTSFNQVVVNIVYLNEDYSGTFVISKSGHIVTISLFFSPVLEWKHFEFIQKNGKFISEIQFAVDLESVVVPDQFMAHTLTYCPNLKNLIIQRCTFQQATLAGKKFSLNELTLRSCDIGAEVLDRWSDIFSKVKKLNFVGRILLETVMPHTIIDLMTFQHFYAQKVFVKLSVTSTNEDCYYKFDPSENEEQRVQMSSAEEYSNMLGTNENQIFFICCKTKPKFKIF